MNLKNNQGNTGQQNKTFIFGDGKIRTDFVYFRCDDSKSTFLFFVASLVFEIELFLILIESKNIEIMISLFAKIELSYLK